MVNILPLSDCLILTSSYEAIPEIMIKMQNIPAFGRKLTVVQGQTTIRCKQNCAI